MNRAHNGTRKTNFPFEFRGAIWDKGNGTGTKPYSTYIKTHVKSIFSLSITNTHKTWHRCSLQTRREKKIVKVKSLTRHNI